MNVNCEETKKLISGEFKMMDRQLSFHGDESGVIATNDDASESKRSCVKLNYYKDEYISVRNMNFIFICQFPDTLNIIFTAFCKVI